MSRHLMRPTAGYQSVRVAIERKFAEGKTPDQIGREIGRSGGYVRSMLTRYRDRPATIGMNKQAGLRIRKAGQRRGLTRDEMVERLLTVLGNEPVLIDNILDDGVGE